jgi:hypothetical protein
MTNARFVDYDLHREFLPYEALDLVKLVSEILPTNAPTPAQSAGVGAFVGVFSKN